MASFLSSIRGAIEKVSYTSSSLLKKGTNVRCSACSPNLNQYGRLESRGDREALFGTFVNNAARIFFVSLIMARILRDSFNQSIVSDAMTAVFFSLVTINKSFSCW